MKTSNTKKALLKKKKKKKRLSAKDFLSTGSTLLNLACTGKTFCGFAKGKYYFIVGDSISGKTWLSLTCLAEASINPRFDNYRFIYDNGEDGALMDIKKFFGEDVFRRIERPAQYCSFNIEEFYYNVDDAIKNGKPFIYILDSMDSLSSGTEANKFDKTKKAYRTGKDTTGSFGDGKAKVNSAMLRRVIGKPLRRSGSILIIINQTRDNVGALPFQPKKTRSGGHALHFYACLEMWSSVAGRITKTVRGKKRQLGVNCRIQIKKNRLTGRERTVIIPIYHSYGINDLESCIDYLLEEGHWKQKKGIIKAIEFDFEDSKRKLIKYIETEEMEKDLKSIVGDVWNEIEEDCKINQKPRYL